MHGLYTLYRGGRVNHSSSTCAKPARVALGQPRAASARLQANPPDLARQQPEVRALPGPDLQHRAPQVSERGVLDRVVCGSPAASRGRLPVHVCLLMLPRQAAGSAERWMRPAQMAGRLATYRASEVWPRSRSASGGRPATLGATLI